MKAVSRIYSAAHLTVSICASFHQICKKITIGRSIEIQQENDEWKKSQRALQTVALFHMFSTLISDETKNYFYYYCDRRQVESAPVAQNITVQCSIGPTTTNKSKERLKEQEHKYTHSRTHTYTERRANATRGRMNKKNQSFIADNKMQHTNAVEKNERGFFSSLWCRWISTMSVCFASSWMWLSVDQSDLDLLFDRRQREMLTFKKWSENRAETMLERKVQYERMSRIWNLQRNQ